MTTSTISVAPMRRTLSTALLAVAIVLGGSRRAAAQDDPRKIQAAPLFQEATKVAEQGQNAESLDRFKKAYAIWPTPNTLFNVARQEQLLGKRLAAIRDYREALRSPLLLERASEEARKYIADLEGALGRLRIVGPDGSRVFVGGEEYVLPRAEPIDVEPGMTTIRGTRGGQPFALSVEAHAGKVVIVDLAAKEAPVTEPPPPTREESSFWGWRSVSGLVLAAGGAVAIGVSAGARSEASSEQEKLDALAPSLPPGEPGSRCFNIATGACADYRAAREARDSAGARADAWLPVGIGAVVVGAGLVVSAVIWPHMRSTSSSAASRSRIVPIAGAREADLLFVSSF